MATDHDNNRSSALSPDALAVINTATAKAVQEAVAAVMQGLLPVFKDMALTPEKLREANRPYEDPAKLARDLRESLKSKQDEAEIARITAARRAACPHLDKNGRSSINLVHNQPDHQPRGICVTCHDWIHPREWRIGAADDQNPRGRAYLVEPHKDYRTVLQLESTT
jgi:hypothetical protein